MRTKACGFAILHLAVEPMEQCIFLKEKNKFVKKFCQLKIMY